MPNILYENEFDLCENELKTRFDLLLVLYHVSVFSPLRRIILPFTVYYRKLFFRFNIYGDELTLLQIIY